MTIGTGAGRRVLEDATQSGSLDLRIRVPEAEIVAWTQTKGVSIVQRGSWYSKGSIVMNQFKENCSTMILKGFEGVYRLNWLSLQQQTTFYVGISCLVYKIWFKVGRGSKF